jgi:hypothetical protein
MPFVVSVTVISVYTTVIGGVQSGWNDAVAVSVKSALPFWTGKSPERLTGGPRRVHLRLGRSPSQGGERGYHETLAL